MLRLVCALAAITLVCTTACSPADDGSRGATTQTQTSVTTTTPSVSRHLPTTTDAPADLPGYHVYRPSDLDATGGPLPVIAWANGGCLRFDAVWAPLLERWAAAGFVVVAITLPTPDQPAASRMTSADDQKLALDWAVRQNATPGGPYEGKLDLDRLAASGNSCGGVTSVGLASADSRVKTVFVVSGSGSLPGTPIADANAKMASIKVPIGYVTGGPEDISRPNIEQDYAGLNTGVPAYVAKRASGDHPTVSTTRDILVDEIGPIGINWFDLVFHGSATAEDALVPEPCRACPPGTWDVVSKNLVSLVRA